MDYLVNLNLNKNELQNARVQNLAAAPSNPVEGQIYHNTVDHVFYYYNGTKWVPVIDDGGVTSITGGTDISVSASTGAVTINHSDIETTTAVSTAGIKKITTDGHGHIKTTAAAYATDIPLEESAELGYNNVEAMLSGLQSDTSSFISDLAEKADAATTLAGYGITDAKIENGTITLGSNTITPLTSQWTANLITGSAATDKANKAGGTNSVYLNLVENNTVRNAHQIVGSGTVTVASDANGKITITGATPTIPSAGTTATAVSTTASGGSATTWSKSDHVHSIALATGDANGQVKIAGTNVSVKGLGAAAYLGVSNDIGDERSTDLLASSAAVANYVEDQLENLPEPMIFKGSLGTGGTITTLPVASSVNEGHTYKVITAGTYASQAADVGDTFISDGSAWVLIPSGDEPSGTVTSVGITNGGLISVSGSPITSSGSITLTHGTPSGATTKTSGFYKFSTDAYGHVNGTTAVAKSDITGLLGNYVTGIKLGSSATASTGEVTVPIVSQTTAGLMSAADKTTLDNLSAASTGAITHTTLTIAQGETSVSASGVASKLITFQAYQGGEAVIVDYDGTNFSIASAAASAITIKCVVTV